MQRISLSDVSEWAIKAATAAKKSGDIEGEILKVAREEGLPYAAVEMVAQRYNTAKVHNYLEKQADNRGATFSMIDVPALMERYESEAPDEKPEGKTAARRLNPMDDPAYWSREAWQKSAPAHFRISPAEEVAETPVKSASDRQDPLRRRQAMRRRKETLGEVIEMERRGIAKAASVLAQRQWRSGIDLAGIERDFLYKGGDMAKEAADTAAAFLRDDFRVVYDRPDGPGERRLIKSSKEDLQPLEDIRLHLMRIKAARDLIKQAVGGMDFNETETGTETEKETGKESGGEAGSAQVPPDFDVFFDRVRGELDRHFEAAQEGRTERPKSPAEGFGDYLSRVKDDFSRKWDRSPPGRTLSKGVKEVARMMPARENRPQKEYDRTMDAAMSQAVLLNLLNDEVLSEADPDAVIDAYNTLRSAMPEQSKDPALARVAVRQMIQYDGIDPQTLKMFSESEMAGRKVRNDTMRYEESRYKGKKPPPETADR